VRCRRRIGGRAEDRAGTGGQRRSRNEDQFELCRRHSRNEDRAPANHQPKASSGPRAQAKGRNQAPEYEQSRTRNGHRARSGGWRRSPGVREWACPPFLSWSDSEPAPCAGCAPAASDCRACSPRSFRRWSRSATAVPRSTPPWAKAPRARSAPETRPASYPTSHPGDPWHRPKTDPPRALRRSPSPTAPRWPTTQVSAPSPTESREPAATPSAGSVRRRSSPRAVRRTRPAPPPPLSTPAGPACAAAPKHRRRSEHPVRQRPRCDRVLPDLALHDLALHDSALQDLSQYCQAPHHRAPYARPAGHHPPHAQAPHAEAPHVHPPGSPR